MAESIQTRRKTPRPPVEAEVRLLDWASRGSLHAIWDDRRVLIDRGAPGELVVASIDRRRKPFRGVVDQVQEASPDRVSPPCSYYLRQCGGCQWQHLRYEAQFETKRRLVNCELKGAGVDAQVTAAHPALNPWRYRRTAAIALGWEAGFRPRGRRGIVEIHDCLISHPIIGCFADRLNDVLRAGALPNYHGKVWLDCTVVGSKADPGLQVVIQGIAGLTLDTHPELPEVAHALSALEGVSTVAYRHRSGEPRPLVGDLFSQIEVDGRMMWLPAGSFFQTNLEMLPAVFEPMRRLLREREVRRVADIYGGVGTFGLPLAAEVESVILVELDPLAVSAAQRTAADWGLENVTFISRHAERALPTLSGLDVAIVDPPRSGLGDVVTQALAAGGPPLVWYVSCSPASLARDLAALQGAGYRVSSLEIFDFYPQTYHVESLAVLERPC